MALKEQIKSDLTKAIKGKEELRSSVLRLLLASLTGKEKEKRYKLSRQSIENIEEQSELSEEVIEAIFYEAKKRREAIIGFEKGGRSESAEKEKKELAMLREYLPAQLNEEEIKKIVIGVIKEVGAETIRDMGKVMKELAPRVKGRADSGTVSGIVKDLLK